MLISCIFGQGKRIEGEGKTENPYLGDGANIYHNFDYRNRNGTYKLIAEDQQCIFGGTNQLYYKEIIKIYF